MDCGVLIASDGSVKRGWTLVSGTCSVPVEHGDEVIHWTMAHGQEEDDPVAQEIQTAAAIAMQNTLGKMKTREQVLEVSEPHAVTRLHRRVHIPLTPPADRETLFCSDGKMASREKGAQHFPTGEADGHFEDVHSAPEPRERPGK